MDRSEVSAKRQQVEKMTSILITAGRELSDTRKKHHAAREQIRRRQMKETYDADRKKHKEMSASVAEFLFRHSRQAVGLVCADPARMAAAIELHKDDMFDRQRLGQLLEVLRTLGQLDSEHHPPVAINWPNILTCPNPVTVDVLYTVAGGYFGSGQGALFMEIDLNGGTVHVDCTILQWSENAVTFKIPDPGTGIPYNSQARITLRRADNNREDAVVVTFNPPEKMHFCRDQESASGGDYPWKTYSKEWTLSSATLPASWRLLSNPLLDKDGLSCDITDNSYLLPAGVESGSKVELVSGPDVSGGVLQAKVKVTDDYYWDYTVSTDFYILIPDHYDVPEGWDHHDSE